MSVRDDDAPADERPRCPRCGAPLAARLLRLENEVETLVLLDCPRGDFYATATREDVAAALTEAIRKRPDL